MNRTWYQIEVQRRRWWQLCALFELAVLAALVALEKVLLR